MPIIAMKILVEKRRVAGRKRVQKHRKKLKLNSVQNQIETNADANIRDNESFVTESKEVYNCRQTLGKAVKKTLKALPSSVTRKNAILTKIVMDMNDDYRHELINTVSPSGAPKQKNNNSELIEEIRKFYERDVISRISPKTKHVKQYKNMETGEDLLLSTRHMIFTIRETFAIFDDERKVTEKDSCGVTFFAKHRPNHVKLNKDLPHDMCMCSYYANSIEAVNSLHKFVPSMPKYDDGFVQKFLCKVTNINCWLSKCDNCDGVSIDGLKESMDGTAPKTPVTWMVWRKSDTSKRIEKYKESGTLEGLLLHITSLSPQFLRHSYVKREQSDTFQKYDRPRASNNQFNEEGMLQIDFAENFVCEGQDEVQSAHWNQKPLTLFTTALYRNEKIQSKVFVSNNLTHTKEAIIPYMYILLKELPESIKILKVWSDGPSSQYKNKFIAAIIPLLEDEFNIKIYWNYFATSHGKCCIDGIGATAKMIVRKHILSRKCIVNCASDFVAAFKRTESKIAIEEVTDDDFSDINYILNAPQIFAKAKNILDISSAHQIQVIDGAIVSFNSSKQGYNL